MRCIDVQDMLPDYADNQLPEVTRRRIDHHLASCRSCCSEYEIWKKSGEWIQADKELYASVSPARSIVDVVMNRILSEDKWAIPIGKKVFTLTARMRRIGASAAVILLMLFSFMLYQNTSTLDEANALLINGEKVAMSNVEKVQVISSSIQGDDGTYIVGSEPLAPDREPLFENATASVLPIDSAYAESDPEKPKYGLILGFFGILVTVIAMSWLTRA